MADAPTPNAAAPIPKDCKNERRDDEWSMIASPDDSLTSKNYPVTYMVPTRTIIQQGKATNEQVSAVHK